MKLSGPRQRNCGPSSAASSISPGRASRSGLPSGSGGTGNASIRMAGCRPRETRCSAAGTESGSVGVRMTAMRSTGMQAAIALTCGSTGTMRLTPVTFRPVGPNALTMRGRTGCVTIAHGTGRSRIMGGWSSGPFTGPGSRPAMPSVTDVPQACTRSGPARRISAMTDGRLPTSRSRDRAVMSIGTPASAKCARKPASTSVSPPGQPPARTSATSLLSLSAPTAPGTTVSPTTKAGVPSMPSVRASRAVSSR